MNEFRIKNTGAIVSEQEFRAMHDVVFPNVIDAGTLDEYGAEPVLAAPPPAITAEQTVSRDGAVLDALGNWVYAWKISNIPPEIVAANKQAATAALIESVRSATQQRLDDFARTRNYDGILSAATYATSGIPKFASEGQYAVTARDTTWARQYEILDEVEAGTRPMPTGFADVEPLLPSLEWPV